jgi:glycosyltransferase involved in cell wall biosynthesis
MSPAKAPPLARTSSPTALPITGVTVSVIVPCFNAVAWIRDTLQSVVNQACENIEILAIDDGSTDSTGEVITREFPYVKLKSIANQGASRARNVGTAMASGQFIQYLDADDILAPGKLQTQLDALAATGADVAYGDWQKLESRGPGFEATEVISRRMIRHPELELFGHFWCPPAAYLFRRSIVAAVGGWNERLPVIQDARFALDCALYGARFEYCAGVMAQYRLHTSGSLSRRSAIAFNRDIYRNAEEVELWWRDHGGISHERREALVDSLSYVARASYESDPSMFDAALADLERLSPGYMPEKPFHLRLVSKVLGYRHAERAATLYRRAKRSLATASK